VARRAISRTFCEIFGVAPRENHLAKAVAVGAGKFAVFFEPLIGVIGEHFGPEVGVVACTVSAFPDVAEVG